MTGAVLLTSKLKLPARSIQPLGLSVIYNKLCDAALSSLSLV